MEACTFHPQHAAVEHCEVCQRSLCDLCLWYAQDGRRLCLTHAREHESSGGEVFSPESYGHALQPQTLDPDRPAAPADMAPYRGNRHDLTAAFSALMGLTALASCAGGAYCLPAAAGILGLVGFMNARQALNPERTRSLGIIGMLIGLLGMIPLILFLGYFAFIFIFLAASLITGGTGPAGP